MKSLKRKLALCFVVLCMTTASVSATDTATQVEEPDNLYALSACLMDAATGRVLFEKEGEEERAMASTTKIMTLVLALEKGELSDEVTISENAAKQPDVQLNVNTGETYRLEDLLYSLMLESHNDTAVAIAEHIGGSVEGFVAMMNEKAKELSLSQTHFVTPNGLDGEDEGGKHRTTAVELAKILSYCITASPKKEEFLKITQTASYTFSDTTGKRTFTCENHNAFLNMMEGAITGKTGFTGEAGYCYVGAVEWEGKTFVAALLGCGWPNNKGYKWKDMKKLIEYGLENYELQSLEEFPKAGEILKTTPVERGAGITYGQVADTTLILKGQEDGLISQREELLLRTDERVTVEVTVPDSLAAPVQEGEVVGKVCYFINGIQVEEGEVLVGSTVEKIDFFWCFSQLFDLFGL